MMLLRKVWKKYPINLCRSCRKKKGRNYAVHLKFVSLQRSANTSAQYLSELCDLNVALSENQTNESRNSLLKNVFIVHAPQTQIYYITFY